MSRSAKQQDYLPPSSTAEPDNEVTLTAPVQLLAHEASSTRLKSPRDDSPERHAPIGDRPSSVPTLIPPPDGTTHDGLLRELAARGARTSWLPLRPWKLPETAGIESLEQDFLNREPAYSAPSQAPPMTVAPPAPRAPLNRTLAKQIFAVVALSVAVLTALEAWSLLHG